MLPFHLLLPLNSASGILSAITLSLIDELLDHDLLDDSDKDLQECDSVPNDELFSGDASPYSKKLCT